MSTAVNISLCFPHLQLLFAFHIHIKPIVLTLTATCNASSFSLPCSRHFSHSKQSMIPEMFWNCLIATSCFLLNKGSSLYSSRQTLKGVLINLFNLSQALSSSSSVPEAQQQPSVIYTSASATAAATQYKDRRRTKGKEQTKGK